MRPKKDRNPEEVLPLPLAVFHILIALGDGERHGYAIKREVAKRTGGKVDLGPGSLYGSIKRMLAEGLIMESEERPDEHLDDERRRYYRLTPFGLRVAQAEVGRMRQLIGAAEAKPGLRVPEPA